MVVVLLFPALLEVVTSGTPESGLDEEMTPGAEYSQRSCRLSP